MKDAGFRVSQVQRELRDRFLKACRAQDKQAAQVIGEFMGEYVAAHGARRETDLQSDQKQGTGSRL